jgi:hypothetical protein
MAGEKFGGTSHRQFRNLDLELANGKNLVNFKIICRNGF